ncbi:MAG TPA: hypothetical protein PL063_01750 [Candidatus Cloacimonadota bacterium]|jgi:hypothetical protein|nr:hypothetical protein [Candidatus Cloacimonadales bacterium]HPY95918.1 hypothetical protein [Candidatus Cloacimonadota bacterium]HQB40901.1 hypothetical protein [Candidatus Cloacimonadota bacterium]
MAVNQSDNRFFKTLCNYLKKNNIEFETIEQAEYEFEGVLYDANTEQFGVVEHNKENLLAAFEQIISMFSVPYKKLFLYRFYFDEIDSSASIGLYTLLYILVENNEIEEAPEENNTFYEEEIVQETPITEEIYDEEIQEEELEPQVEEVEESVIEEPEAEYTQEEESADNCIEAQGPSYDQTYEKTDKIDYTQEMQNDFIEENCINSDNYENIQEITQQFDNNFYLALQQDIDFLIKLLAKSVNPEISEVLSKAILVVIKNHLNQG